MNNTTSRKNSSPYTLLFVVALAGCDFSVPTPPETVPTSCAALPDGTHTLGPDQRWLAQCTGGRTYLPLARENYSQYRAGGYSPGTDVTTYYRALRIDPATFLIDVSDQTHASSTGGLEGPGGHISAMPYGVAMDCVSKLTATGSASIDLRDTPFAIDPAASFEAGGLQMKGAAVVAPDGKTAALAGGGECGWMAAGHYNGAPVNQAGGLQLPLRYQP